MQINVSGVENLVKALAGTDTVLVHFSSDYVYHVPGPWPILELQRYIHWVYMPDQKHKVIWPSFNLGLRR